MYDVGLERVVYLAEGERTRYVAAQIDTAQHIHFEQLPAGFAHTLEQNDEARIRTMEKSTPGRTRTAAKRIEHVLEVTASAAERRFEDLKDAVRE